MLPLGMGLGLLGYGVGTWGYILVKGFNITLREWFSPLHPFTGSLDSQAYVPKGVIFPIPGMGAPPPGPPGEISKIEHDLWQRIRDAIIPSIEKLIP